jgi:hypothetical protein
MNPLLKFNLVFLPLLAVVLGGVAYVGRNLNQKNARENIAQNARLIMEAASASRAYTSNQVAPLLRRKDFKIEEAVTQFQKAIADLPKEIDATVPKELRLSSQKKAYTMGQQSFLTAQKQLLDAVKGKEAEILEKEFHSQSVPAFAATEIFNLLRQKFPDYFYKEATLNPTNKLNLAKDWEADVVNQFRNDPQRTEIEFERASDLERSLVLARPSR